MDSPTTTNSKLSIQENTLNIKRILDICRKYWYLIALCAAVCTAIGWYNYKKTVPVYQREALVLVVRSDQGNDISTTFAAMSGMFQTNPEKMTELVSLTTPTLMIDVTRRLNLNVSYSTPGKWYPIALYGATLPVLVEFPGLDENLSAAARGEILPDGKFRLTYVGRPNSDGVWVAIDHLDLVLDYTKGDIASTSAGQVTVKPNPLYSGKPLTEAMPLSVSFSSVYNTALGLAGRIDGSVPNDWADIISLKIVDAIPQRAVDILNTVVSIYNENWIKQKAEVAESTSRFINDRLNVIEQELGSVDSDISNFKSSHGVPDVNQASSMFMQQATAANNAVRDLSTRLAMTRYVRDFMATASNSNSVLPANTGVADVNIESQIAEYNRTLMERNSLAANSSSNNPLVADLDVRLDGYRRALVQSLDNQITSLNTSISSVQRAEDISAGKVASSPGQARYLLSVERQQKVKENLYLYLLQKREENELAQKFVNYKIRMLSEPLGSPSPIAPNRNNMLMTAFIIGLVIPIGIIVLREYLDNKIHDRQDLADMTVPLLGELPKNQRPYAQRAKESLIRKEPHSSQGIVVTKDNLNLINEAFRLLRTNVELVARHEPGTPAKIIAVTSANPGSGKTFVAMNLASALSIKGHKVLIVDMDWRRGSLSRMLSKSSSNNGLVNYLVSPSSFPGGIFEIIQNGINDDPNLDLLSVGTIPPNPAELLAEPELRDVIYSLRDSYDYIFFDCPPVEVVADSLIMNDMADMTLFIVRAGLLRRGLLKEIQNMYDTKRYRNMTLILNATQSLNDDYYGGKYYYYGGRKRKKLIRY